MDLAEGHLSALNFLIGKGCYEIFNLGTGKGYSVLDIVKMMEKVSNKNIPYKLTDRRKGDIPTVFCRSIKSKKVIKLGNKIKYRRYVNHSWNYIK